MADSETITDFEVIWRQYPRHTAKVVARKAWRKLSPDTATVQQMIEALTWQTQTDQWRRGVIPHFSTWLNQARWEDERPAHTGRHLGVSDETWQAETAKAKARHDGR